MRAAYLLEYPPSCWLVLRGETLVGQAGEEVADRPAER